MPSVIDALGIFFARHWQMWSFIGHILSICVVPCVMAGCIFLAFGKTNYYYPKGSLSGKCWKIGWLLQTILVPELFYANSQRRTDLSPFEWSLIIVNCALLLYAMLSNAPIQLNKGTKTPKIRWTEPREITEQIIQDKTLPRLRTSLRRVTNLGLLGSIPISLIYLVLAPSCLPLALIAFALAIYSVPLSIWWGVVSVRKSGIQYQIDARGVHIDQRFYSWGQIKNMTFTDYPPISGVGSLDITLHNITYIRQLKFDKQEVDEHELRTVCNQYFPMPDSVK